MKRFESKDRDAPAGTRSGPRARAAQDRKFGATRSVSRDPTRADPYQRADRPARPSPARDAPYAERLRAPVRSSGIELDPDVARVFRDSEAVNEALRMVIRLARLAGGSSRPAFNSDRPRPGPRTGPSLGPRSGPPSRPRAGAPRPNTGAPPARYARDKPSAERRGSSPPVRREPRFEESE